MVTTVYQTRNAQLYFTDIDYLFEKIKCNGLGVHVTVLAVPADDNMDRVLHVSSS